MYSSVKTVNYAELQLNKSLNRDHTLEANSTLNQKLSIQSGVNFNAGERPEVEYLCIGRGGVQYVSGDRNLLLHTVEDACFFEQMPFVMRETTNDLGPDERARYRLRVMENIGGKNYFVYYGLKVDLSTSIVNKELIDTTGGTENVSAWTSDASRQSPTPVSVDSSSGLPITTTNVSIKISASVEVVLTTEDIQNIIDAAEIKFGSPNKAIITEVGFCSGVDRNVTSTEGGVNVSYDEVIGCQVAQFIADDINLITTSTSYTIKYGLGTTLRLLT